MSRSARILVVDDDADIRRLARTLLESAGHEVRTAADGLEGLAAAQEGRFDLILLDINMPEMDGWETLRLLKAEPGTAPVPVVLFSVKGEVRDKMHGVREGAEDYITKPFLVDEFLARVERVLTASTSAGAGGGEEP